MIKDFKPRIGKTVIETLTMGMYDDARFIFREYVQNAADQIDVAVEQKILASREKGLIKVTVNAKNKSIEIEDNATGIPTKNVLQFLGDIANSEKDERVRKGFRGIGRLGGLGYCEKLTFITSSKGESVCTQMTLDARLLKKMLLDRKATMEASAVISVITDISTKKELAEKHYFKVSLESVTNPELLKEAEVRDYLSQVTPVPFDSKFTFRQEIKDFFADRNVMLDEYKIEFNAKQIFKPYLNKIKEDENTSEVLGVDFFQIKNGRELLALGWYGYRDKVNIVLGDTVAEKGIRLRKHNIQIGNEITLNRFFKSARTNQRFIGELHALNAQFIPNARRDYFIDNNTCQVFEKELRKTFEEENLENLLAHTASNISNRVAEIEDYQVSVKDFEKKKKSFKSQAEEMHHLQVVNEKKEKAIKAQKVLTSLKSKADKDKKVKTIFDTLTRNKTLDFTPHVKQSKSKYNPPKFSKLTTAQAKIVLEIFEIIEQSLKFEQSEDLKRKIVERYN